jgi:hypothetical protein
MSERLLIIAKKHLDEFSKDGNPSHLIEALKAASEAVADKSNPRLHKIAKDSTIYIGQQLLDLLPNSGGRIKSNPKKTPEKKTPELKINHGSFDALRRKK